MNRHREVIDRVGERFSFPGHAFERMVRRRDRKRRNQWLAAAGVVIMVAVLIAAAFTWSFVKPT